MISETGEYQGASADTVEHHYDIGTEFYRLWAGRWPNPLVRIVGRRRRPRSRSVGESSTTSSSRPTSPAPNGFSTSDVAGKSHAVNSRSARAGPYHRPHPRPRPVSLRPGPRHRPYRYSPGTLGRASAQPPIRRHLLHRRARSSISCGSGCPAGNAPQRIGPSSPTVTACFTPVAGS